MSSAREKLKRAVPWLSMAVSIGAAFMMERTPERAPLVAVGAGLGWVVVTGLFLAARLYVENHPDEERRGWLQKGLELARFLGMQNLTQLCVFFALPFYIRASSLRLDHGIFLLLLAAAGACSLWDPLYAFVLRHPIFRSVLQAFCSFAALNCVLPILGLSNRISLYVAAVVTVAGSPLLAKLGRGLTEGVSKPLIFQTCAAILLPMLIFVGASSAVPPAPLRLVEGGIGTQVEALKLTDPTEVFESTPRQLVCFTQIGAPRGLSDELLHVWRKDGTIVDRIPLEIRGGRAEGYRTWSIKKRLTKDPPGDWSCTVETKTGQVVGRRQAVINRPEAPT